MGFVETVRNYKHHSLLSHSCHLIAIQLYLYIKHLFYPVNIDIKLYEPRHEISINVVYANSKASDQPAHMRSLIGAFASRLNIL